MKGRKRGRPQGSKNKTKDVMIKTSLGKLSLSSLKKSELVLKGFNDRIIELKKNSNIGNNINSIKLKESALVESEEYWSLKKIKVPVLNYSQISNMYYVFKKTERAERELEKFYEEIESLIKIYKLPWSRRIITSTAYWPERSDYYSVVE